MKRPLKPIPNFNSEEVDFNVKATRGYLFTAAMHVLEGMKEQNVAHAEAAVMTAALEFAALLWMQSSLSMKVPRQLARKTAEIEFRTFLVRHSEKIYEHPEEPQVAS